MDYKILAGYPKIVRLFLTNLTFLNDSDTINYDSDGRIIKQSDGLEFIYDASGIAGVKYGIRQFFYRKDAQGNIKEILDADGKAVIKYIYDAWGNHKTYCLDYIAGEGEFKSVDNYDRSDFNIESTKYYELAKLNPFRYRGYYYDTETKLYYLQTRYYDPEVGRFISQDSVEYADPEAINGLNLYAYCGNNPVMNVDPTGSAWWHWLAGVLAVAGAILFTAAVTVITAGVGTTILAGTLAGAVIHSAAVGTLIGAGIGITAGGIIGGAVSGWTAEGILTGMGIGFGAGAIIGAVIGGTVGGISYLNSTTALYRAVDLNEYNSIKSSGQFSLKNGALEGKQFGLKLSEVRNYARLDFNKGVYSNIVKTRIPNSVLNQFSKGSIDTFVFKSGVVTVSSSQMNLLNNALIYLKFLVI